MQGNAQQVFSVLGNQHDWSDIGISNGILYDFDGSSSEDFYHKNLINGNVINIAPSPASLVPRQTAVDWNGTVYNVGSPSTIAAGTIVPYLNNGTVNVPQTYNITFNGVAEVGSWGDAGEAFKPKTDFGDAPATYDPGPGDPATHEIDDSLRLGLTTGIEWAKKAPFDASGDGAEEDGLSGPQVISTGVSNYVLAVSVYNHTGAQARLCGWIDKDNDGIFEVGESATILVNSSVSQQSVNLLWSSINIPFATGTVLYMRLRISSLANGMTTSTPTGFFDNGEVEDYRLTVSVVLPDQNVVLKAQKVNTKNVSINWDVNNEDGIKSYELQRSNDGTSWYTINSQLATGNSTSATYTFLDLEPEMPLSYFRIKANKNTGESRISNIKEINFKQSSKIQLTPNPASNASQLSIHSATACMANVTVLDFTGRVAYNQSVKVIKGPNFYDLPIVKKLSSGVYKVRVQLNDEIIITTLVVVK